jgi:thioredoxin reductase
VSSCRSPSPRLPVAVIGAGPVGLAAAAHLLARGLDPLVLEAGPGVGTFAHAWGHVRMFSPWRYNMDKAVLAMLHETAWLSPHEDAFPAGSELVERYLEPLAKLPEISSRLRLDTRVTAVTRVGFGKVRTAGRENAPFELRTMDAVGREGSLLASAVIDTSGTWATGNWAGASGIPAMGETAAAARIAYGMPDVLGADRARYAGRKIMVVGSGDSAKGTLIELAWLAGDASGTAIVWVARNPDLTRAYGGGAADGLAERGALGTRVRQLVDQGTVSLVNPFAIAAISGDGGKLTVIGTDNHGTRTVVVDELIVCTGFRPDLGFLGEVRLDLDPALECPRALAPLIDPNIHSCGSVRPHGAAELEQPEANFFIAGMKSYGRAPTFLLATGYEQVRSIAAYLAGDIEASRRVELDLPETGVCSSNLSLAETDCCGTPAVTACCVPATGRVAVPAGE